MTLLGPHIRELLDSYTIFANGLEHHPVVAQITGTRTTLRQPTVRFPSRGACNVGPPR